MIRWRDINPLWKCWLTFVAVILIIWLAFAVQGCAGPVIPKTVASSSIAFDGNEQNAGLLISWPGKGGLLTDSKKAEYDALVRIYGHGTEGHPLIPPIKLGAGLTQLRGRDNGFPLHDVVWHFSPEALANFYLLKSWSREGRSPGK